MNRALIVVDVQNDFCEGGSLPVPGGNHVAERIGELIDSLEVGHYDLVAFSKDDHLDGQDNGGHFSDDPNFTYTWPAHCVQGTRGNFLHPRVEKAIADWALRAAESLPIHTVLKGHGVPAYSAFEGEDQADGSRLIDLLERYDIDEVDVCGIATDHCVLATAMDAVKILPTRVLINLTAGVALDTTDAALQTMHHASIRLEREYQ